MTQNILNAETGEYKTKGSGVSFELKRGEASWAYFPLAYNILLTIVVGIISFAGNLYKISALIIVSLGLFYLCFFGPSFRNKIVGLFSKSKEFVEKS